MLFSARNKIKNGNTEERDMLRPTDLDNGRAGESVMICSGNAIAGFVNKVLLAPSHTHRFTYCL